VTVSGDGIEMDYPTYDILSLQALRVSLGLILLTLAFGLILASIYFRKKIEPPNIGKPLENLSKAKGVQEIAASQIDMLTSYYGNVLTQSQRSFNFALLSGGVGLLFIMATIGFLVSQLSQNLAIVTTLGAALSGFISGVNFYVYNKSSSQMGEFHNRLNKTQNFLVADGMCDKLDEVTKNQVRSDLIRTLAGIPLTPSSPQQIEQSQGGGNPESEEEMK